MKCAVIQDLQRYMNEQDKAQSLEARFESLCEEWEGRLERQEPEAVESFKEWLYGGWFDGSLPIHSTLNAMQETWAEMEAEEQMARERIEGLKGE